MDARHAVAEGKRGIGVAAESARDRRGTRVIGGAGERYVPFSGKQSRGRIEADPPGTGDIDFSPCMQVGEILVGAGRPVERFDIGHQLHQVSRHEARRQPEVAQDLHQQPAGVAAGAELVRQCMLAGLHAWFHAHGIIDGAMHTLVDRDQKIDDALRVQVGLIKKFLQQRTAFDSFQIRGEFLEQLFGIFERIFFCVFFQEEIKRVDDRHFGNQIDLYR